MSSRRSGGGGGVDENNNKDTNFDLDRSSSKANNGVRRYIRHMSDLIKDPIELDLDIQRLQNALREAGEHSLGVDAITVWLVDEESGKLFHPEGGWWRSSNMEVTAAEQKEAVGRLEDSTRLDYVPANAVLPGSEYNFVFIYLCTFDLCIKTHDIIWFI